MIDDAPGTFLALADQALDPRPPLLSLETVSLSASQARRSVQLFVEQNNVATQSS